MAPKNTVVYHHTDSDGLMSLYVITVFEKLFEGTDVIARPMNYGDDLDDSKCNKNTDVYFVDFIPDDYDFVIKLASKVNSITVIDHHASKIDFVDAVAKIKNIKVHIQCNVGTSAAMLAHNVLMPQVEPPKILTDISNFDTHNIHNGKEAYYKLEIPMNIGFMFYHNDQAVANSDFQEAFMNYYRGMLFDEISDATVLLDEFNQQFLEIGLIIFKSQMKNWKDFAVKASFEAEIHGKKAICLNINDKGSMQFDAVYDPEKHDMMFGFSLIDGKEQNWSISCYSDDNDSAECGEFCKKHFGGGGHPGAAGGNFIGDIFSIMKIAKS